MKSGNMRKWYHQTGSKKHTNFQNPLDLVTLPFKFLKENSLQCASNFQFPLLRKIFERKKGQKIQFADFFQLLTCERGKKK